MKRTAERWAVGVIVLLVHVLLLSVWQQPRGQRAVARPEPAVLAVTLLPAAPPPPRRSTDVTAIAPAPAPAPRPRRPSFATPNAPAIVESPTPNRAKATAPEPGASAITPLDLRLALPRGSAERGGLSEPQDSMRRRALNDPRSNIKPDPTQVLPDAVAASAKGDCLQGSYPGGGMGLLSAPFLAYAALSGSCRPQR